MATFDWPSTLRPSKQSWAIVANGTSFVSPFSGATQTMGFPGSRWKTTLTFENMNDAESRLLETLIVRLNGQQHRVRLFDFGRPVVAQKGTPLVNGAGQSGDSISTDGWAANTLVLSKGDFIQIATEYKQVLDDVTSNASGQATINIGPMLRYSPADNAVINVTAPSSVFMQTELENGWDRKPAFATDFSLSFIEAFP